MPVRLFRKFQRKYPGVDIEVPEAHRIGGKFHPPPKQPPQSDRLFGSDKSWRHADSFGSALLRPYRFTTLH